MPKVYKVVKRVEGREGRLFSCVVKEEAELEYIPGKTTVAKMGGILCFRCKRDAVNFIGGCSQEIWRCFALSTRKCTVVADWWCEHKFYEFWLGELSPSYKMDAPTGTVIAPSVTLISKVVSKNGH